MESPHGDPTTPRGARMRLAACAYPPASDVYPPVRIRSLAWADRKTGRTADTQSRAGMRAAPAQPYPMQLASSAYPVCLPCPSAMPVCVILSMRASHAHPAKRPFVNPFYHFPICQNVTY